MRKRSSQAGTFHAGVKHLDSDLLLDLAVNALRKVHGAHAAGADEAQSAVRSPIVGGCLAIEHVRCCLGDGTGQLVIVVGVERQQRFDFGADIGRNLSLVEEPSAARTAESSRVPRTGGAPLDP